MDAPYFLFRILVLAAISEACTWNYGCNVGYCVAANQDPVTCSCSQCTCLDACLTGLQCSAFLDTPACNNCAKNPCPNADFNCTNGLNTRTCACDEGRTGENCEFVVGDICASYPCLNGGTCTPISSNTAFSCSCPSAYTGQQCHVASNPCSSVSCTHGTCTPIFSGTRAVCVCADTWQGAKCDQTTMSRTRSGAPTCYQLPSSINTTSLKSTLDLFMTVDKCEAIMMANSAYEFFVVSGSLCYVGADVSVLTRTATSSRCSAPCLGNLGQSCAGFNFGLVFLYPYTQDSNSCNATPPRCNAANSQGYCVDEQGSFSCVCAPGWRASDCGTQVNPCFSLGCSNGATCVPTLDHSTAVCKCAGGYTGSTCNNKDGCHFTPCKNGGLCNSTDTSGGYNCTCEPSFTDASCGTYMACYSSPCVHGTCQDGASGVYTCHCNGSYAGVNCDACKPSYTGQNCNLSIIIYNILQKLGGNEESEADLIALMEQLLSNPSMTIDMIPFIVGTLPEANRTELSWTVDDTFLWAAYEEKALNTSLDLYAWSDVVLGNCFTFNHFNNTARSYLMRQAGAQGALKAALKINSHEYAPWIDTNAIMVFVHPNSETVFSESPRYNCMPSTEAVIETTQTRYVRLGKPYGVCVTSPSQVASYFYQGTYTTDGCIHSCYQVQVQKACGCMDSRYPVPESANLCQLKDVNCVNAVVAKGDVSTWADCVCPLPCNNAKFDSAFTQANFVINPSKCHTYTAEQRLNDSACDSLYGKPDYVIVSIRVPSLTIRTFKETPAMSFNTMIGNIAGLGGVVCGLNLISFFEFGFYFLAQLPMTLIFNREIN